MAARVPIVFTESARSFAETNWSGLRTVLLVICLGASPSAQQAAEPATPAKPIEARFEDGAEFRWLNKKVLDSRVLDSMEDLSSWSFAGAGEMTLTEDHTKDGEHALRIRSTSNIAQVGNEGE